MNIIEYTVYSIHINIKIASNHIKSKVFWIATTSCNFVNNSTSNTSKSWSPDWLLPSPCSFREKVLTGDFVEKRGLQNTNPSRRMAPNALQNISLGKPKWLPTTKYKTKIIKNHQIRAVYKIDWKKSLPLPRLESAQNRLCGVCSGLYFVENPPRSILKVLKTS